MAITNPIKSDDDIYTLAEWREAVEDGVFMDCDGFGDAIIWDGQGDTYEMVEEWIYPSGQATLHDSVTHIIWYNK